MLVAYTEQNEPFILKSEIPLSKLHQLRKTKKFYCPQCKEQLQFRIGTFKIPHFAHRPKANCINLFSEGESENHLLGKEQLYNLFKTKNLNVELEPYLKAIKQRPDLLVTSEDGHPVAVEFQCSPISVEKYTIRTTGYQKEKMTPVWIPITPVKIQFNGIQKVSINYQYQQFINNHKQLQYMITYNPTLEKFIYLSNLMHLQGNRYLAKVQMIPLLKQNFPFYIPKIISKAEFIHYLILFESVKHNYLYSRVLISKNGVNDLLLRSVYELRLNLQQLPSFIGIPIRGSEVMKTFATDWQVALFYFLHQTKQTVSTFKDSFITYFLRWARLPETSKAIVVVRRYCLFLEELSIEHVHQQIKREVLIDCLYSHFLAIYTKY